MVFSEKDLTLSDAGRLRSALASRRRSAQTDWTNQTLKTLLGAADRRDILPRNGLPASADQRVKIGTPVVALAPSPSRRWIHDATRRYRSWFGGKRAEAPCWYASLGTIQSPKSRGQWVDSEATLACRHGPILSSAQNKRACRLRPASIPPARRSSTRQDLRKAPDRCCPIQPISFPSPPSSSSYAWPPRCASCANTSGPWCSRSDDFKGSRARASCC